jgi:hypothetical protein
MSVISGIYARLRPDLESKWLTSIEIDLSKEALLAHKAVPFCSISD